ncbi:ACS family glucarate transporter-like MFS transporter [Catalinimonas alkaloidigena]|uniref:MFS transporter n=1 Tax=Catalinimonas alkaloidigena TaxID=1075417 RepID=UPI0024069230|nr:MFS transporter [Catalinimonas alkaloidigena]MDF9797919.1 ACS family glucarate transporter-like MFS transporter [Catalinimonas alkaloidigena]
MGKPLIPGRHFMVAGTFLLALLLYIDRVCISVAKDPIAQELDFSDKQMGWILSVFALGYALFQTPAGILADRLGPRRVLTAVVSFWSIFTALTGAVWSFVSMLIVRFLFGAGEAGAFPGISRAVYSWIPLKERGLVTGINFSGSRLGAAFALPFVAWLILTFGWRTGFLILGVMGVVWAVAWYFLFRDEPAQHWGLSDDEKNYILSARQSGKRQEEEKEVAKKKLNAQSLFGSKNMWLAMLQYFCSNFTFFFCLTWLFPHLKSEYQLDTMEAGIYSSAPLVFGAFGNWFSGWWVDHIYRKGSWQMSRRIPAMTGFALAAIGLLFSIYMETPFTAIAFLSIAIFGADMTLSPSWSFTVDIGRENAGAVSGTMNMAGNIGSFLTALAFPYLQSWTGSVEPFFYLGAGLNVLAILLWTMMKPDKSLEEY